MARAHRKVAVPFPQNLNWPKRNTKQTKNNETNESLNIFVCFVIFRLFRVSLLGLGILAQFEPLQFSRRCAWQLIEKVDSLGLFVSW
jgi:hypothetical protein